MKIFWKEKLMDFAGEFKILPWDGDGGILFFRTQCPECKEWVSIRVYLVSIALC